MDVYCGIDWAEDHHDIAVVDRDGKLVARRRISDDPAGLAGLLDLLAEHGDSADDPVPVAIETPRGLLVACLRATGRPVYPVNPMAVARYRDRHSVTGKKSDHGDSVVLANVLRTDMGMHRPLAADSELAQAIAVLARAQQDATLTGSVQLVTPWPQALTNSSDWRRDARWQDWPMETLGGVRWREPGEHELTRHAYLMASSWLVFPLRVPADLPPAPSGPDDCVEAAAQEAVATLVRMMNAVVVPVIETLERS